MDQPFDNQIAAAQSRLRALCDRLDRLSPGERVVAAQAVEALSHTLEELHVAAEELHQQHDELSTAQRELQAEHRRYRELFDLAPDGYLVTDDRGVIVEINRAASALLGVSSDYAVGKPLVIFVPPGDSSRFYAHLERLPDTMQPVSWEMRLRPRSGVPFDASLTAAPTRDDAGALTGLRWLIRDISARVEAQQALAKSQERLELALAGADQGLWDLETQTGRLYLSPRSCAILGFAPDEVGTTVEWWVDRIHPEDRSRVDAAVQAHLDGETPQYATEYRVRTKSGACKWILDRGQVVERDAAGNPLREAGIHLDVTERKEVEAALRQSEQQKNLILDATSEMVAYYDPDLRVIWANRAAGESVGKRREDLVGLHCYEIWHQRQEPCAHCPVLAARDEKAPCQSEQQTPDGRDWLLRGYPILDHAGEVIGLVEFGQDITESKRARAQIEADAAEKEALLHEIHHRVKNNLQVIASLLDVQAMYTADPRVADVLNDSKQRVRAIALIHEELYQPSGLSHIDMAAYLQSITADLQIAHRDVGRAIQIEIAAPEVVFNVQRALPCGLIVNELVSNAFKHAFPPGAKGLPQPHQIHVALRAAAEGGHRLTIHDNGVGLPADFRFPDEGSFGLFLVDTFVRQLDGEIEWQSEGGARCEILI